MYLDCNEIIKFNEDFKKDNFSIGFTYYGNSTMDLLFFDVNSNLISRTFKLETLTYSDVKTFVEDCKTKIKTELEIRQLKERLTKSKEFTEYILNQIDCSEMECLPAEFLPMGEEVENSDCDCTDCYKIALEKL